MIQPKLFPSQTVNHAYAEKAQNTLLSDYYCIITLCAMQAITLTALAITFELTNLFVGAFIALLGGIFVAIEYTHAKEKIESIVKKYF